jgi:predicted glutamine amidotransferase
MCRMLGIKNFSYTKHKRLIEGFFDLAREGKVPPGNEPGHLDGWGLGFYRKGKAEVFKSGRSILKEKEKFFGKLRQIGRSTILIAHLRKSAWQDTSTKANSHPFKFKNYIFAHNGTIFDYKKLAKKIPGTLRPLPKSLDSEVMLRGIAAELQNPSKTRLKDVLAGLRKTYKHSSLTCLFSDGSKLQAFREYTRLPRYYTLYLSKSRGSNVLCSEPLTKTLFWQPLTPNKLFEL